MSNSIRNGGGCDFCDELRSGSANEFRRRYASQLTSRFVFRSREIAVVPTLGQLAEGHVLVIPVEHFCACADLPTDTAYKFGEVVSRVRNAISAAYGRQAICLEHGARTESAGGCGIYHAHMHVIPFDAQVAASFFLGSEYDEVASLARVPAVVGGGVPYAYYQDVTGKCFASMTRHLASQHLRMRAATILGKEVWDWRAAGHEPTLVATVSTLRQTLGQ